jgi:hypothetical protein
MAGGIKMSASKSTHELKTYVNHLYSRVAQGLPAFHRQLGQFKGNEKSDAAQALQSFREDLQLQRSCLEHRIRVLGGGTLLPVRDAAASVVGLVTGVLGAVRPQHISQQLREDYVFLGDCAAAYLRLFTIATSLSDPQTAQLADRGYRDSMRMMRTIERIMPGLIIHELRQTGAIAADASERAQALVQDARTAEELPASGANTVHRAARLVLPD